MLELYYYEIERQAEEILLALERSSNQEIRALWEVAAYFDAVHLSRGQPQAIVKLFNIAQRTNKLEHVKDQAIAAVNHLQAPNGLT